MSVIDFVIKHCNRLILEINKLDLAQKLWELGNETGVSYEGNEKDMVAKIMEMETRDRADYPLGGDRLCYK